MKYFNSRTVFIIAATILTAVTGAFIQTPRVSAVAPKSASVPVKIVSFPTTDARVKRQRVSASIPVFRGNEPVVEFASERSYGMALTLINAYIKEEAGIDQATMDLKPVVTLARPALVSLYYNRMIDTGGAHPASDFVSLSCGLVGGKASILKLPDLFMPGTDAEGAVLSVVARKLKARGIVSPQNAVMARLTKESLKNWVVTPSGITFLFAAGEIDTYASGHIRVPCSWRELESGKPTVKLSRLTRFLR